MELLEFRLNEYSSDSLDVLYLEPELSLHAISQQDAKRVQVLSWEGERSVLHVATMRNKELMKVELQE